MGLDLTAMKKLYIQVSMTLDCIFVKYCHFIVNTRLNTPTVSPSLQFVLLSWQLLPSVTNVTYEYEVAYSVDSQCTDNSVS